MSQSYVAHYLRETTAHRLANVRRGVAVVLEGGPLDELVDALVQVYDDAELWVYLEALTHGWLGSEDATFRRCGQILEDGRRAAWNRGLDALS